MDIKETVQYENLIDKKSKITLFDVMEIEDTSTDKEWKKHWKGMPEYEHTKDLVFKSISVHFRNLEDYEEFVKLVDQPMTQKTKSIWYPRLEKNSNLILRWIEDD